LRNGDRHGYNEARDDRAGPGVSGRVSDVELRVVQDDAERRRFVERTLRWFGYFRRRCSVHWSWPGRQRASMRSALHAIAQAIVEAKADYVLASRTILSSPRHPSHHAPSQKRKKARSVDRSGLPATLAAPRAENYLICESLLCADCATSDPAYCETICCSVLRASDF